jgi:sodium/potassium/calcium exchanger 6
MIILAFYLLGNIADCHLTPILTKVSTSLALSETVAGVTLLAFANGAPDIIASVAAAEEDDGIFIGVGGLFGACTFAATVVLGYCIEKNRKKYQGVQVDFGLISRWKLENGREILCFT